MEAAAAKLAAGAPAEAPIAVMIVDDSAVIRGVLTRMLEESGIARVVGSVSNGAMALTTLPRVSPDIVILDIEMPVMDGLTALPQLLKIAPQVRVIMASTLTQHGAEATVDALRLGAADYIPKPAAGSIYGAKEFQKDLLAKIVALSGGRRRVARDRRAAAASPAAATPGPAPIAFHRASSVRPAVIGIGSSTGGPQALHTVLTAVPAAIFQPILITQHMPATFTRILADQLARASGRPSCEGSDGMPVESRKIYVAPGGFHMVVAGTPDRPVIRITSDAPENYCRPAVDPLFRSLAALYGPAALVTILTGMGADGAKGCRSIAAAGGTVLAQDEATSVVWGMPGAAAATGTCSELLPLAEMGPRLWQMAEGKAI